MKRWILYIAILALVAAAPTKSMNIGKLLPVKAVGVYKEENWFRIETDTGNRGFGGTVSQALRNMKDTASGTIYLDTAEYLILTKDTQTAAQELEPELRPSVRVCMAAKKMDLAKVAEYLDVHTELPKLRHRKKAEEWPVISTFGDGIIFLKKVEKRA